MSDTTAKPASEKPVSATARRRSAAITTTGIASFSLTLLAGGIGVVSGLIPMAHTSAIQRLDIGALLLAAPIVALLLAVMVEVAYIALRSAPLPDPQPATPMLDWQPGRREG